jgi:hypothetical protein
MDMKAQQIGSFTAMPIVGLMFANFGCFPRIWAPRHA